MTTFLMLLSVSGALSACCHYRLFNETAIASKNCIAIKSLSESQAIGLAPSLTHAITISLTQRGNNICPHDHKEPAILTGTITHATSQTTPTRGYGDPPHAYTLRISLDVRLLAPNASTPWQKKFTHECPFLPSALRTSNNDQYSLDNTTLLITESHRRRTMSFIAQALAEAITQQLLIDSHLTTRHKAPTSC